MTISEFRNRYGIAANGGLPSFCTANEFALTAIVEFAAEQQFPVLIEATCNQVNQEGGYTGLRPKDFAAWVRDLASRAGVADEKLILGGDHLGPNPWCKLDAATAMAKAELLVKEYVQAGFTKIHIDTSMACGDEPTPSFELVAARAAQLCEVAEKYAPDPAKLVYVIGTEVPTPGGEVDDIDELSVTTPERFRNTVSTHTEAFRERGISQAESRVIAVVTQPGVDFSHTSVHRFDPPLAADLAKAISEQPGLVFEAHSTDYQPTQGLRELVDKKFAFLKVGPELTFRMREAVFSLVEIEALAKPDAPSGLIAAIDRAMDENPDYWQPYYQGDLRWVSLLRHYSYSDRIRYYWTEPGVKAALERLLASFDNLVIPETMISQHFPYRSFEDLALEPQQLVADHIKLCVSRYYTACGF